MKKILLASALVLSSGAFIGTTAVSCTTLATSNLGLAIIKQVLLGGISRGMGIFSNKDAFLQNDLIDKALPSQLRQINSVLQSVAPGLVAKEKEYIAQAAAYTVNVSRPILENSVNSLNANDVSRIMSGTTATQVLKEKASQQLVAAIAPKVDEKLNQFGIVKSINMALQGSSMLGSLFGNTSNTPATGGISQLASEQMVNGLFHIIENYEQENKSQIMGAFGR